MLNILLSKKVIGPIIILITTILLNTIMTKVIKKIAHTKITNDEKRKRTMISLITNTIKYFLFIIAILMILNIYGIDTTALITSLGIVGLVAGLAFQDLLKDILAGFAIIFENQYSVGDTVTINDFKGEVLSLGLKTTKLKAYTGEVKFISNRNISEVINHSITSSLAVIELPIPYEIEIEKIEKVLNNLCQKLTESLDNIKGEVSLIGLDKLDESSIIYKIQVETEPLKHYEVKRKMLREIKIELDKKGISIPYNQVVIHDARV